MDTEEERNQKMYEQAGRFAAWQYRKMAKHIRGRVLEVGCGNGRITRQVYTNPQVTGVVGIDTNRKYLETVRSRFSDWREKPLAFSYLDLSKRKIPKQFLGQFDTVISINALEHIKDDTAIIRQCYRLLKPGGRVILLVPALKFLFGEIDRAENAYRRFSRREIRTKAMHAGFQIEKLFTMNFFGIFAWFYHSRVLNLRIHRERDMGLFDRLVPFFRFFEAVIPVPVGLSYIIVGRK